VIVGILANRLDNGTIPMAARLNSLAEDTWCPSSGETAFACLLAAVVVYPFEVEGVDMAGDVAVHNVLVVIFE
jgi:hypothetical protein